MANHKGDAPAAVSGARAWRRAMVAIAAIGVATGLPAAANANCQLAVTEMPVTMKGSRAVATVGINGVEVPLVVDTGATYSMLTDAAAGQLKLRTRRAPDELRVEGLTGAIDVRVAKVDRLKLFKGEIPNVEFLVGGNDIGIGFGSMGLLGRNLMSMSDVEFDLAHGVIRFASPNADCDGHDMAYWAGSAPVASVDLHVRSREVAPALRATGRPNGKDVNILFDTGATSFVTLGAARRAGIVADQMAPAGRSTGAGEGSAQSWTARFKSFELGGEAISNNRMEVVDVDLDSTDMYLGIDFFLSHRLYVSRKQQRIFFTYNGGAVFELNTSAPDAQAAASGADAGLDADGYARRGAASEARRDHTQALADFDEALRIDPMQPEALLARATLNVVMRARDGALVDLDTLDKSLAPQAQMRLAVAGLYKSLALPERALAQWDLWLASHPNDHQVAAVLNQRCWTRAMLNIDLDKALDDCDKAIDLDDGQLDYVDSRGWVYLRMGKLAKAVDDFDRVLKRAPDAPWSLYGRGIARSRLGDAERGRVDLEAARKAMPGIDDEARQHGIAADVKPAS